MTADAVVDTINAGCCIVGGGPAGVIAALLFARRGVDVVLLEAHHDFDRDFRGDTLHPAILEILDEIGLAERVHELPHVKLYGPLFETSRGRIRPVDLRVLKTRFPYVLFVHQALFLEFLVREARQYSNFRLILGGRVQQLVEEDGVFRGVRYRTHDGWHEVRAAVTIGADGRFSTVRNLAGITPVQTSQSLEMLWFRLPRLPVHPDEVRLLEKLAPGREVRMGRHRILVVINRADHWQLGLLFRPGEYSEIRAAGLDGLKTTVVQIEPLFTPHLEQLTDWRQVSLLAVASSWCRRWYKPGLLLIGDAAHTMSPVGGAGIKHAVEDAVVAANVLVEPIKAGTVDDRHLARVQRQRAWPTRIFQWFAAFGVRQTLRMLHTPGEPRLPWFVPLIVRTPLVTWLLPRVVGLGFRRVHVEPRTR